MNSVIQSLEYKFGLKNRSSNLSTTNRRSAPTHRRGPGTDDTSAPYTDRCIYDDGSLYSFYGRIFGHIRRPTDRSGPDRRKDKSPRGCSRNIPTRLRPVEGYSAYHRLSHDATLVAPTTSRPTYGRLNDTRLATVCQKTRNPTYYHAPDTAPDDDRLSASTEVRPSNLH